MKKATIIKYFITYPLLLVFLTIFAFYLITAACAKRLYNPIALVELPFLAYRVAEYGESPNCEEGLKYLTSALFNPVTYDKIQFDGVTHEYALPPFTAFVKETEDGRKVYYSVSGRYGVTQSDMNRNAKLGWIYEDSLSTMNVFVKSNYMLHMNFTWQDNRCISSLWVGLSKISKKKKS